MSSRWIDRIGKSLGVRLSLWYFFIFVASSLVLTAVVFFSFTHFLAGTERETLKDQWALYSEIHGRDGLDGLLEEIRANYPTDRKRGRLLHLVRGGESLWLTSPGAKGNVISPSMLFREADREGWVTFDLADSHSELDLYSRRLAGDLVLQMGFLSDRREAIAHQLVFLFLTVFGIVVFTGFVGALFFSGKALRPLRNLTATVNAITSGRTGARVPVGRGSSELDELVVLFNEMLERNERLIEGMKGTLDNVAHDFRTPLTRMRILVERALIEGGSRTDLEGALMDCGEELERLTGQLTTLMDISEAETGVMSLNRRAITVGDVVEEVADMYRFPADEKGLVIRTDVPRELVIFADPQRIFQVMGNLLDNAVKYTSGGGTVSIGAHAEGDLIRIDVSDTGIGIPEKDRSRIFERLYRVDSSRSEKGLGLGLSIARAIVRAHGGSLTVTSVPGEGSTFSLRFPRLPEP